MPIAYFKDRFMEESECRISLNDRSFRLGDGIFETMLVANGKVFDIGPHLARLKRGLEFSRFGSIDYEKLPEICLGVIRRNALSQGFVRIMVSRGVDAYAAGYLPQGSEPYLIVRAQERSYPGFAPIRLWRSAYTARFSSPAKTTSALPYVLAMMEATEHGCDNALLPDAEGHICETASGNLFWLKEGRLYTPAEELPMVPGTTRERVLALWRGNIIQGKFTIDVLHSADEIFMTNTSLLIAPVTSIEPLGISLPVGSHTSALRRELDQRVKKMCI